MTSWDESLLPTGQLPAVGPRALDLARGGVDVDLGPPVRAP